MYEQNAVVLSLHTILCKKTQNQISKSEIQCRTLLRCNHKRYILLCMPFFGNFLHGNTFISAIKLDSCIRICFSNSACRPLNSMAHFLWFVWWCMCRTLTIKFFDWNKFYYTMYLLFLKIKSNRAFSNTAAHVHISFCDL